MTEAEVIRGLYHPPRPGVEAAAEMERTERHFKGQMTGLHSTWCQMEALESSGVISGKLVGGAALMEMEHLGSEA